MRTVQLFNQTRGELVCARVEVADTSMRRLFGLLGRRGLDPGEGLWIKPSSGVHTFGMMFPIDVVGLDRKGIVIKLWRNLVPFRVTSVSFRMESVIELRAGQIDASNISLGDTLELAEEAGVASAPQPAQHVISMNGNRKPDRDHQIAVAMLLLFAAGFRTMLLYSVARSQSLEWFYRRGHEMAFLAVSMLNGQGLSSPFGGHTGPSAMIGPVFPFVVKAIFHIFGPYSFGAEVAAMSFQAAVSVLNVWLVLRLGTLLAGRKAGWIAAIIWAFSPAIAGMLTVFWDTTITTFAVTAMILLAAQWRKHVTDLTVVAMGACCGVAALINPALLPLCATIPVWLACQTDVKRLRRLVLSLTALLAVFAVWPVRNAMVLHAFVPMRTTPGIDLWMGNHEGSDGHLVEPMLPMFNAAEMASLTRLGEVAYDHSKRELFSSYVKQHPAAFFDLSLRRFFRFWTGTGDFDRPLIYMLQAIPTLLGGLAGMWWLARRKRSLALLLALPLLIFPLPYYLTHADFRYRAEIDPLMTVLAACAMVQLAQRVTEKRQAVDRSGKRSGAAPFTIATGWTTIQPAKTRELP